jgi:hypothetical protein
MVDRHAARSIHFLSDATLLLGQYLPPLQSWQGLANVGVKENMARKLTTIVPSCHVNPICLTVFGAGGNFKVFAEREMIFGKIAVSSHRTRIMAVNHVKRASSERLVSSTTTWTAGRCTAIRCLIKLCNIFGACVLCVSGTSASNANHYQDNMVDRHAARSIHFLSDVPWY